MKTLTFGEAANQIAIKYGLGKTLVTGHKASYFIEAHELVVASRDKEIKELKEEIAKYKMVHDLNVEKYNTEVNRIQHLEEVLKAADETSWNQGDSYHEAKEIYNKLKAKQ